MANKVGPSKRTLKLLQEIEDEEKAQREAAERPRVAVQEREPDDEPDESIPHVETRTVAEPAAFNPADFATAFASAFSMALAQNIPAIVKAVRESGKDPELERIKTLRKQTQREDQVAARRAEVDKWLSCDHMRTHPYTGTARIGWAQQSDGYARGVCMGCGCPFTPIDAELPDPIRMKGMYAKYRAIPTTIAKNDFLHGMVVAGNPA
jgi:hypothetical protein